MKHSPQLRNFVANGWEQLRIFAYPDPNVWTIGYGRTRGVKKGDVCTVEQAEAWLDEDLEIAAADVRSLVHVQLAQHQFDALVSFLFNLGKTAEVVKSTLLKRVNGAEHDRAALEMLRWHMSAGKRRRGLMSRRCCEALMYGRGEYVTPDD